MNCKDCTFGSCALPKLNDKELKKMAEDTQQTSYQRKEILRRQGSPLESIIYLRSGYVKEFMFYEKVPDQVIQIVKPRSYIGLQGLCSNTSSEFSYQAITPIEVCFINKETFGSLIRGNGEFAREILIALSNESLSNQKRFLGLNQKQIFGKVAGLILYLADDVYENDDFPLHLDRSSLAQMIASTRESVSKTLSWMAREGIIDMKRSFISIQDKAKIIDLAQWG